MGTTEMEIAGWREKIDGLDRELVRLLDERAACARAIGEIKRAGTLPIYEPEREAEVVRRAVAASRGGLDPAAIARIFATIMEAMRAHQVPGH